MSNHLRSDGNRKPAVHDRLDEETPELFRLDRPADGRDACILENETKTTGCYLLRSTGIADFTEHLVRQRHLLA